MAQGNVTPEGVSIVAYATTADEYSSVVWIGCFSTLSQKQNIINNLKKSTVTVSTRC